MAAAEYDAICVGESMALVAPDPPGPLRDGGPLRLYAAGAEANVAVHLARMGNRAAWVGRVGADSFGAFLRDRLGAEGVDVSMVEIDSDAPTGIYFKERDGGVNHVWYYRAGSAASRTTPALWERLADRRSRIVHLSGITAALSDSCRATIHVALSSRPRPCGASLVSFDVNYRSRLWPVTEAGPVLLELARAADAVFVGRDEAETLWGTATAADIRALLPEPAYLIVKDGDGPATEFSAHGEVSVPAPSVEVVEPVGAGDAFAAGWLHGYLNGRPASSRLRLGHLMAEGALRSTGDWGEPPDPARLAEV